MINRLLVLLIPIGLFLTPIILAYDFGHFPLPFIRNDEFNVVGVVGANSDEMDSILLIELFDNLTKNHELLDPYILQSDDKLIDFSENIISVGGPCANKVTARIMELPTTWPECASGFEKSIGRIKMYNKWNKTQLIIAGYDVNDTKEAVKEFERYDVYNVKMTRYTIERNERIEASKNSNAEPPFDIKICLERTPDGKDMVSHFCSCGDGVCASYEYMGECILDCGPCPDGTFFRAGECVEFIENSCLNSVCDEGEEETCPWDCPYLWKVEEEESEEEAGYIKENYSVKLPEEVEE